MFLSYRDEYVVNMLTDFGVEAVIVWTQLPNLVEVVKHNINAFGVHQEKTTTHSEYTRKRRRSILTLLTINFTYFSISSNTMRVSSSDRSLSFALNSLYKPMQSFASSTEGETFFFFSIILSVIKIL